MPLGAGLSLVLVRERERDDRPPIIELNDLLNPEELRAFISGGLSDGEAAGTWAELVRSKALSIN